LCLEMICEHTVNDVNLHHGEKGNLKI